MARFILDVDSSDIIKIMKVIERDSFLSSNATTIVCIDKSNDNQFHENSLGFSSEMNKLTSKQIEEYNKQLVKF